MESNTPGAESVTVGPGKKWLTSRGNIAISFCRYILWWRSLDTHSSKTSSDFTYRVLSWEMSKRATCRKDQVFIKMRPLLTCSFWAGVHGREEILFTALVYIYVENTWGRGIITEHIFLFPLRRSSSHAKRASFIKHLSLETLPSSRAWDLSPLMYQFCSSFKRL